MPDRTPLYTFPGVENIVSMSGTFTHGITPSVFTLVIAPQDDFEGIAGDLVLFDGEATITFVDCKVDRHSFEFNEQGQIWRLQVLDRRWKWRWGAISGFYNMRNDDGSLKLTLEGNQKSPQELAALCLEVMEETDYDIGDLPDESRPITEWDQDLAAEVLAQICDELGCRVVLGLDDNVSICLAGEGEDLPDDDLVIDDSLTIDPPEQPDSIAIACGKDRFQADFLLRAVGQDTDGTVKAINDLSYAPTAGWSTIDLPDMIGIDEGSRAVAVATVLRWYQIVVPCLVPDYGEVTILEQITSIEGEQVARVAKVDDQLGNLPAIVFGSFCTLTDMWRNSVPQSKINPAGVDGSIQQYKKPFDIDRGRAIVIFSEPVFSNGYDQGDNPPSGWQTAPAKIYLRAAVAVRDPETFAPVRYTKTRDYGDNFGTPTRTVRHDEIVLTHRPLYSADNQFNVLSVTTNKEDSDDAPGVDSACDYLLDGLEQEYQTTFPQTIKYAGMRDDVDLDGAIMQISFDLNGQGCTTTISRNDEQLHRSPTYAEKRAMEKTKLLQQMIDAQKPLGLRQAMKYMPDP
jgi:hypothetical protein